MYHYVLSYQEEPDIFIRNTGTTEQTTNFRRGL